MAGRSSNFSRSRPLRGPDGPTPDYVEPQTGNFGRIQKILAVLSATLLGAFLIGIAFIASPLIGGEETGFALVEDSVKLSVVDSPTCELELEGLLTNLEDEALTITAATIELRQNNGSGAGRWPRFQAEGSSIGLPGGATQQRSLRAPFDPEESEVLNLTFSVGECDSPASQFEPRGFTIFFARGDGTTGVSELGDLTVPD
jgi:hypothetical protein